MLSCFLLLYQLSTNKTKIEQVKKLIDAQENKACDEPIEPPARKISRRI